MGKFWAIINRAVDFLIAYLREMLEVFGVENDESAEA